MEKDREKAEGVVSINQSISEKEVREMKNCIEVSAESMVVPNSANNAIQQSGKKKIFKLNAKWYKESICSFFLKICNFVVLFVFRVKLDFFAHISREKDGEAENKGF